MAQLAAFEAEDIVKYGNMMIKRPPTSNKVRIKAWQSKFFVLRDETRHSVQRLEYYKDEAAFVMEKREEHSFFLDSIVYIGETHNSKTYQFALMVVCSRQGAFTLACDTVEDLKDWLQAFNKVAVKVGEAANSLSDTWAQANEDMSPATTPELPRRAGSPTTSTVTEATHSQQHQASSVAVEPSTTPGYLVTTRLTPLSEKNNIRGDYFMHILDGEVTLQSANDRSQTVETWPVIHLRAFKSEATESLGMKDVQLLTLNFGRRSPTGEGILQFFTKLGDTVADEIRLQSNYYVCKTAADKRDAFRQRSTSSFSSQETRSPPSSSSYRKLPRTMTAPPERLGSVIKREGSPLMDSVRKRAGTDPVPVRDKTELSITEVTRRNTISETGHSVSSEETRSRSETDSSIEKTTDDEVFVPRRIEEESDTFAIVSDGVEPNAYIDLLPDENAEPIHISVPAPRRRISVESPLGGAASVCEEGATDSCLISGNLAGNQCISDEGETDAEGYIKCEALQTGPQTNEEPAAVNENSSVLDSLRPETVFSDQMCVLSGNQAAPSCSLSVAVVKKSPSLKYLPGGVLNQKLRESLVSQIQDPVGHNGSIFPPRATLERERALTSECVFPPRTSASAGDTRGDVMSRQALQEKLKDPKKLVDQIIAQMENPQDNDVNELFPADRQKRNSIGSVSTETVSEIQQQASASSGTTKFFVQKKHTVIEKSNSTCESFSTRETFPSVGPPPLPLRPEIPEPVLKRVSSSSMGDIFEDMHRKTDLFGGDRPTFFAKGMRNKNPSGPLGPLRNTIPAMLGGEAGITARLIKKTEIRDEELALCTSSTRKLVVNESKTCSIANGGSASASREEHVVISGSVLEKKMAKSLECLNSKTEEETTSAIGRRKDSRASKIVKRIWKNLTPSESPPKHPPKPRRGSNESRGSDDVSEDDFERPRRASLSPADAVVVQRHFSESEEMSTPDSSPQMKRKISKSSPKTKQKISKEDKSKRKEDSPKLSRGLSSATRMLRKVSKNESKKRESSPSPASPISTRDLPKMDTQKKPELSMDANTMKRVAPTTASSKPPNAETDKPQLPHKSVRRPSRGENSGDILEGGCELRCQKEDANDDGPLPTEEEEDHAPALPPRRKSDPPPPLPPRRARSTPSFNSPMIALHSSGPHGGRSSQASGASSREGRRHSGQKGINILPREEFLPPPPVPPRLENSRSPSPKTVVSSERTSARAPVIQLTCSSPESQLDPDNSSSGPDEMSAVKHDKVPEDNPPNLSTNHGSPDSLSHPVPRRPPKGERRLQAKEFFRSGGSSAICEADNSEFSTNTYVTNDTDNNNTSSYSPRYGNIDDLAIACNVRNPNAAALCETRAIHVTESSSHVTVTSSRTCMDSCHVIQSHKEGAVLKINLMKEASFEESF